MAVDGRQLADAGLNVSGCRLTVEGWRSAVLVAGLKSQALLEGEARSEPVAA